MDVVAINRYYGWYEEPSHPKASQDLAAVLDSWYSLHKKPVMVTEWGAGAVAGIHKVGGMCMMVALFIFFMILGPCSDVF